MKIFFHYSVVGFSNSYLIGSDDGGDAILVDPGVMDIDLLDMIEDNGYYIRYILLTHRHSAHTDGIRTIRKIYDAEVYANNMSIMDIQVHSVADGEHFTLGHMEVTALQVPGHSTDSLVYRIGNTLFTGDALFCGRIGPTTTELSRSLLMRSIIEKLMELDENCLIFPGHGPPSTLKAEKLFNPDILQATEHHESK